MDKDQFLAKYPKPWRVDSARNVGSWLACSKPGFDYINTSELLEYIVKLENEIEEIDKNFESGKYQAVY